MDTSAASMRPAAAVLLVLSIVRWGVSLVGGAAAGADRGPEVLEALSVEEAAAVEESERARRPLEVGERIDPNRVDAVELDRLPGVGPATAAAIVQARDAGAVFRVPADLAAVRGLGPRSIERLRGALDLSSPLPSGGGPGRHDSSARVDLNLASASQLVALTGVGPVLAERIVAERRRGRFRDLDDLTRVPGVGPATVERLRGQATVGPGR